MVVDVSENKKNVLKVINKLETYVKVNVFRLVLLKHQKSMDNVLAVIKNVEKD